MTAAAGNRNAADGSSAAPARKPGPLVDAMLHLEKSGFPGGIHVVGDGGAAEADCAPEDLLEGVPEVFQLGSREAARDPPWADAGTEQALVGINVADPGEKRLVEKSGLYRESPVTE